MSWKPETFRFVSAIYVFESLENLGKSELLEVLIVDILKVFESCDNIGNAVPYFESYGIRMSWKGKFRKFELSNTCRSIKPARSFKDSRDIKLSRSLKIQDSNVFQGFIMTFENFKLLINEFITMYNIQEIIDVRVIVIP